MKKILLIILLTFSLQKALSQAVFCPPGARWHYRFHTWLSNSDRNEKITYVHDSIVGSDTVKVLFHNYYYNYCNFSGGASTLIKQKGDTIFMRSLATNHSWQILYNFAATAGQTWTITVNTFWNVAQTRTYTITVDSVKNISANNFTLKSLYVRYQHGGSAFIEKTQIIERFGCVPFMFNYRNPVVHSDCDQASGLLCYEDLQFGLIQFTDKSCDYSYYMGVNETSYTGAKLKIYPNPADNFFSVATENEQISGEMGLIAIDVFGREFRLVPMSMLNSELKFDVSYLQTGLYFLKLNNNGREIYNTKLLKN
ncbi:MAG: T9SS type A sorting domain-containing protein [Bacteroidota bacterium]